MLTRSIFDLLVRKTNFVDSISIVFYKVNPLCPIAVNGIFCPVSRLLGINWDTASTVVICTSYDLIVYTKSSSITKSTFPQQLWWQNMIAGIKYAFLCFVLFFYVYIAVLVCVDGINLGLVHLCPK